MLCFIKLVLSKHVLRFKVQNTLADNSKSETILQSTFVTWKIGACFKFSFKMRINRGISIYFKLKNNTALQKVNKGTQQSAVGYTTCNEQSISHALTSVEEGLISNCNMRFEFERYWKHCFPLDCSLLNTRNLERGLVLGVVTISANCALLALSDL